MNKIIQTGDYTLRAVVTRVTSQAEDLQDSFHLAFTTQLANARFPLEQRTAFSTTFDRDQLTKLRDILTLHLDTQSC